MALASQGVGGGPPVAPDRSLEPIPRPGCGLQRRVSADGARSFARGSPPRLSSPDARTGTGEHSGQLPPDQLPPLLLCVLWGCSPAPCDSPPPTSGCAPHSLETPNVPARRQRDTTQQRSGWEARGRCFLTISLMGFKRSD